MFRRIMVPFCLLLLCMGLTVQADASSEEENMAASGQTAVKAWVEPTENPPDEEQPDDKDNEMPQDDDTQANGHSYDVTTGDMNKPIVMLFLLLISSIVLMAGKVRSILKENKEAMSR